MGLARIAARFERLREEGRAGFAAYVMAGDPDRETSQAVVEALPGAGADLIEVGFPFSDPMAEGPPIQRAAERALAAGMTLAGTLAVVERLRARDRETPLVLMGYLNPLLAFGLERFAEAADRAGVDGLIVVDCPLEEEAPLAAALSARDLALVRLAAPTTAADRLERIASVAAKSRGGFTYFVSVTGVTGVKEARPEAVAQAVARLRRASGLPVVVGFGVRTPERAAAVARIADAVAVGSALVDAGAQARSEGRDVARAVGDTAAALAAAVRGARAPDPL